MQRPRPSGGLHRFFAPACALTALIKEEEVKAKEGKESVYVVADDETENDIPISSSPLLLQFFLLWFLSAFASQEQ